MKKSNIITFASFLIIIAAVILFMLFYQTPSESSGMTTNDNSAPEITASAPPAAEETQSSAADTDTGSDSNTDSDSNSNTDSAANTNSDSDSVEAESEAPKAAAVSMDDALFIGDSRTVGLLEYAGIDAADFFADVGMSVYNIHKKTISVPSVGKVSLTELLKHKSYGKIYIMLGINEAGYKLEKTVDEYKKLIAFIEEKQPDAAIFIQANLYVTKSRSDSDKVINNRVISTLNSALSSLADGKKIFCLDVNPLFDDGSGNLSSEKSEDNTHLYGKYYAEWGKWIIRQTASLTEEGRD